MAKRHKEALEVQDACNPGGVAALLSREMSAFMRSSEYTGTDSLRRDPALRLIAYKLADLFDVSILSDENESYLRVECEKLKDEAPLETWEERAKRGGLTQATHMGALLWIHRDDVNEWARIVRMGGDPLVEIPNWDSALDACASYNYKQGDDYDSRAER
jgi:hypothetical protein